MVARNDRVNGLVLAGSLPSQHLHDAAYEARATSLVAATETNDVDEQAALLRGWNQTYNQLSSGSFSGYLLDAKLDKLHFFRELTSNSLHQTGELARGLLAIGVPLSLKGQATFCGRACDGSQIHVFSGRDGFEFHSPRGLDIAGLVIDRNLLLMRCTAREREFLETTLEEPHLRPASLAGTQRLRAVFSSAIEAMASTPELATSPSLSNALLADVLAAVTEALTLDLPGELVFTTSERRWQIVRNARQLAAQSIDGTITVEDLCATLASAAVPCSIASMKRSAFARRSISAPSG